MMGAAAKITAAAVVVTSMGCFVSAAHGGSYVVTACSPTVSAGSWVQTNDVPAAFATGNLCGGPIVGSADSSHQGALYGEDILGSAAPIPDGARAGWTFTAPPATTIAAVSYYRHLAAFNDVDLVAGLYQADGAALEECKIELPLGSPNTCSIPNNQAPKTFTGLSTSGLFFGVRCRIVRPVLVCGAGGAPRHAVQADLYSARVTLSENSVPVVSLLGGALWGAEVVSGVVPVTFAASDPSGIKEQVLRSDAGDVLASTSSLCDFAATQPCPQQPSGSLSVDTTRVPDGRHTFSLVVTDAAGNSQVATSPSVLVDNNGPPPPAALMATAEDDGSNVVALTWRDPLSPPAPVARGIVQLCQATCGVAKSVDASGAARITAPGPGTYSVRLWLIDVHGRGGPHNAAVATVRVPPPGSGSSTVRTRIAAVLKARRLRVSGTIARSGRVRVSWRSKVRGRTVGHGSRLVTIRDNKIALTFSPSRRARSRAATIRIAVRVGDRIVAQTRARRG